MRNIKSATRHKREEKSKNELQHLITYIGAGKFYPAKRNKPTLVLLQHEGAGFTLPDLSVRYGEKFGLVVSRTLGTKLLGFLGHDVANQKLAIGFTQVFVDHRNLPGELQITVVHTLTLDSPADSQNTHQ